MRRTLAAMLVLGLLILGVSGAGCGRKEDDGQSTPQKAVEAFITAFQQKNLEAIDGLYRGLNPEEKEFVSKLFAVIEIKSFQVDEVTWLSEKEAEVKVSIVMVIYNREKTVQSNFRLIKIDRRWCLSGQLP